MADEAGSDAICLVGEGPFFLWVAMTNPPRVPAAYRPMASDQILLLLARVVHRARAFVLDHEHAPVAQFGQEIGKVIAPSMGAKTRAFCGLVGGF